MSPARTSATSSSRSGWQAWMLAVLVTFGFPTVFSGGTCIWSSDDCDDDDFDDDDWDDCDWDDDDTATSTAQAQSGQDTKDPDPYRLIQYERVASHVPGAHPVAWLRHIRGINLFHDEGPASYQEEDFEMFTGLVLQMNKDLLGLPPGAGLLTFDSVAFATDESQEAGVSLRVRWRQEAQEPNGSWKLVPDSEVVFFFDAVGNLVTIRNHTWVQLPQR